MDEQLQYICTQKYELFLKVWEELVTIDSGSNDEIGLAQISQVVRTYLEEKNISVDVCSAQHEQGFTVEHVKGSIDGCGETSILLLAHLDTVFDIGTAKERPFKMDQDWAYGPGVSDCKGGVTLALLTMEMVAQLKNKPFKKVTLFLNCDEEISSPTSKDIILSLAKEHDYVLCLEPGAIGDGVTKGRKGTAKLHLEVCGKASHSGSDPYGGANALMELALLLGRMNELDCREKGTSVVFTKMASGKKLNIIPDYAEAWADVRVEEIDELDRLEEDIKRITLQADIEGTTIHYTLNRQKPPMPCTDDTTD